MGLGSRSEDCCCCIGVKAGTLILLYLDLFVVVISMIAIFSVLDQPKCTTHTMGMDVYGFEKTYQTCYTPGKDAAMVFIIICSIYLIIVVAGLFAVGKKKPSLLIPYFIVKVVDAIALVLILTPFIFLEKKGLDFLDTPKAYNKVLSDVTGDKDNGIGKSLDNASYFLAALIVVEILLIILQIHYAKVVYACYKKIEEELEGSRGIIYESLIPPSAAPYAPLHLQQQTMELALPREPAFMC